MWAKSPPYGSCWGSPGSDSPTQAPTPNRGPVRPQLKRDFSATGVPMAYDVHADPELDWSDDYVEMAETLSQRK